MRSSSRSAKACAVPVVRFEAPYAPPLEVDTPEGGRLLDVCDAHGAAIPFSCRSATCGTCRVDVLEGLDLLEPPARAEIELLALLGNDPRRCRLACQARVRRASGRLWIRPTTNW